MKLTGKLKEKVEKAETKEQAKELIASAGMELTDDEMDMDMVSGGVYKCEVKYRNCHGNDPVQQTITRTG